MSANNSTRKNSKNMSLMPSFLTDLFATPKPSVTNATGIRENANTAPGAYSPRPNNSSSTGGARKNRKASRKNRKASRKANRKASRKANRKASRKANRKNRK